MSDGAYLLLAAGIAALFVVAVLATNPEHRNPHVDSHHRRSAWWRRNPH